MRHLKAFIVLCLFCFAIRSGGMSAGDAKPEPLFFDGFPGVSDSFLPGMGQKKAALLDATLLAESSEIAPGIPFSLVLTLNHQPGSYSYWTNPGGPGVGTTVVWSLPEGFSIAGPEWPTPELYQNGGMTFYVYKGKAALVFTVTPPEDLPPGTRVAIRGEVNAQACTPRSCNPLRLPISVKVVAAARPGPSAPGVAAAREALPLSPRNWRFEAMDYDGALLIGMHPLPGSNPDLRDVRFFDSGDKPFVDSQKSQLLEKDGGVWWLRLPRLPGPPHSGRNLTGIIVSGAGWREGQNAPESYVLDLPILNEEDATSSAPRRTVDRRVGLLLLFAFLGGLILNVMPCVFPVIGLKIMGFARQAHQDRRAVFLHGLAYTFGVLLCFWALSILVITMGRGWGAQLQSEWFLLAMCHLFLLMSLNMAGVFEVGASVSGAGQGSLVEREGLRRSFFTGLLATLTSTPCSAPFLGSALAFALSLPPFTALGVFTLMGLGFSFPYLALSLFPGLLKRLPRPGAWMVIFKQAMAFPLLATTAYLFWTIEAMLDEWRYLMLLFGLVVSAMACWLYGLYQRRTRGGRLGSRLLLAGAALLLVGGVWMGAPRGPDGLTWQEWSPETVTRLRAEGRPVYVDFTARWCATCQLNKRVYTDRVLQQAMLSKNVALLKADWTQYDERITSTLRDEFDKAAVPVTVLYLPGEPEAVVLPDILTVETVMEALLRIP